jgi:hypothetical protein
VATSGIRRTLTVSLRRSMSWTPVSDLGELRGRNCMAVLTIAGRPTDEDREQALDLVAGQRG